MFRGGEQRIVMLLEGKSRKEAKCAQSVVRTLANVNLKRGQHTYRQILCTLLVFPVVSLALQWCPDPSCAYLCTDCWFAQTVSVVFGGVVFVPPIFVHMRLRSAFRGYFVSCLSFWVLVDDHLHLTCHLYRDGDSIR